MDFHTYLFIFFFTFLFFVNTWGLESESILGINNLIEPKDAGFHVTVHSYWDEKIQTICGASIVTEKFALTAGHCLKKDVWAEKIYVGPPYFKMKFLETEKTQNYKVVEAYKYPLSNTEADWGSDIAAVKLNGEFKKPFFPYAEILKLPEAGENYEGVTNALVSGMGKHALEFDPEVNTLTTRYSIPDNQLRVARYKTFKKDFISRFLFNTQCVNPTVLCGSTLDTEPTGVITYGDSGGPLIYDNKLIGILVAGLHYVPNRTTTVYFINVAYYRTYLDKIFNQTFDLLNVDVRKYIPQIGDNN